MRRLTEEFMAALQGFEASGELPPLMVLFDEDGEALNLGGTEPARYRAEVERPGVRK